MSLLKFLVIQRVKRRPNLAGPGISPDHVDCGEEHVLLCCMDAHQKFEDFMIYMLQEQLDVFLTKWVYCLIISHSISIETCEAVRRYVISVLLYVSEYWEIYMLQNKYHL